MSIILSMLCSLTAWAQIGGDFNPENPSDPGVPEIKHTLTLTAFPVDGGSFNIQKERFAEGSNNTLRAYANPDFVFKGWSLNGTLLSTEQSFSYVMPKHDVSIVGIFEYNPANPANPGSNYWDKKTGHVIVDEFQSGSLYGAIQQAISGSGNEEVTMITVAGRIGNNDFGVANNYSNCTLLDLSRVTGVTEIPSYAFDYTNLETVYLPFTIEKIGTRAFADCTKLSSITVYAMTPPTLESSVFQGVPEGLVVYVPAAALHQYLDAEGWKEFTLFPMQEDISNLRVNLPEGINVGDYTNMWLELINKKNDQKLHYVMTDRTTYTFSNIIHNTSWDIVLCNQDGDVFGRIDDVQMKEEDVNVTFASLSKPQNVNLSVVDATGKDVTAQTQVTWTDAEGHYIAQGTSLKGLPSEKKVNYRVTLSQELAMQYNTPSIIEYVVQGGNNNVVCKLESIEQMKVSGLVKDAQTNMALSGATVCFSQVFGGKYTKTINVKTDSKGQYTLTVAKVPTSVSVAAADHISQTADCEGILTGNEALTLPDVLLKAISGAVISLNFTYTTCAEGEDGGDVQNWYSDYNNINYTLYNKTKQKNISQYNVQYPQIVLLEEVDEGDVILLTATSRKNAFMPVEATATIDDKQQGLATFNLTELGKIKASFTKNENASVVGVLYDANGKMVKTYNYTNATLTIDDLTDGAYTLVTMGKSAFFNTIYDIEELPQTGLLEATDYVKQTVDVKSGLISTISIDEMPTFNESKLYYTGDGTSFTVNKPSIVIGNYLTLTGHIDFKPAYVTNVSNVQMIVDLPESCSFVENSVMVGSRTSSYILEGSRITIPMTNYTDRVRFCVIPTLGGEYAPSAFVQFDLSGRNVTQPIGSAFYTAKDLSINVPSTVAKTVVSVSGTANGTSDIEIYDNGVLIGQTTSLANGTWITTCELNEPYNLSTHQIYTKVTTKQGLELKSETKECLYDRYTVEAKSVTMSFYNGWLKKNIEVVFDLENQTGDGESYMFYTDTDVTFVADLTNNDTTVVKGVTIRVYTDKGNWHPLYASYDKNLDRWVAVRQYGSNELPVGVMVDFIANVDIKADRTLVSTAVDNIGIKKINAEAQRNEYEILHDQQERDSLLYESEIKQLETLASQIEKLSSTEKYDDSEMASLISQYCTLMGFAINAESIYTKVSDEMDEETTRQFLLECRELIGCDDGGALLIDSVKATITSFDFAILSKDSLNYEAVFDAIEDTLYYEHDGVPMMLSQISPKDFDWSKIDSTLFEHLPMTEGKDILVYAEDKDLIIIDRESDIVWIARPIDNVHYASRRIRRISGKDIVESLREAVVNIETFIQGVFNWVDDKAGLLKDEISEIEKQLAKLEKDYARLISQQTVNAKRLSDIERQLEIINQGGGGRMFYEELQNMKTQLLVERGTLMGKNMELTKQIQNAKSQSDKLKNCRMMKLALLGTVLEYVDIARNLYQLVNYGNEGIRDINEWNNFINSILPCKDDYTQAVAIKNKAENNRNTVGKKYGAALAISTVQNAFGMYMTFNPAAKSTKWVVKTLAGVVNSFLGEMAERYMEDGRNLSQQYMSIRKNEKSRLKCSDDKCPKCGKNPCECDSRPKKEPERDPSGYVYEGVFSNRVQGATATVFYKEMVENMYGDLCENIVKWDAAKYAQENPLFTDEYGYYRWDVPQGLWQVKFEKEGYETTYSEWLPVPPPQLEVNIGMVQARQPEVKGAHAYRDGVEVEFDKYMQPELLNTDNIMVSQNGTYVEGSVKLMNEEKAYMDENTTYASKVRFVPTKPFSAKEVTLYVNNRVKSYANIPMADSYSQTFDIEKEVKSLVVDSVTNVPYTGKKEIAVYVLPADAAEGKKMRASSAAELIASLEKDEVVIDANGLAQFTVNGELPGATGISFSIDGLDVSTTTMAKVEMEPETNPTFVPKPTASITAGSSVYRGTGISLNVEGDGLKVWYTTDGSCPCDENGTRKVYSTPIAITGDMVIKAMAETAEGDGSDVATFTYSILRNNDGIALNNGWTWASFNMASDALANVNTALASGAWTVNDEIKNDRYTDSYSANQRKWIGTLSKHGKLDNTGMFKIHSSQAQTLQLTGEAINPQTVSITVNPNWNYIAYLPMRNLSVAEALAGYDAKEGDVIKSQDAFAVYSANGGWQGDLTTMIVGQGYMLKRSASAGKTTFNYPDGSTGARAKKRRGQTHLYADNMNVIGRVMDVDTEKGDSLIAMVNGKVRGTNAVQENGMVFLTIQGDETENVELVLQRDGEQIAVANAPIRYESNDILGTLDVPTDIKFATASRRKDGISVTPCIVENQMTIEVDRADVQSVGVSIYSMNGTMVAEAHQSGVSGGRFEKTFNLSSLSAGVYLVTISVNDQSNVVRILKK